MKIRLKAIGTGMPLESLPFDRRSKVARLRAWFSDVFTADAGLLAHAERGCQNRRGGFLIDLSVYPDVQHADSFGDDFDRADYVQRICAASDFGVLPAAETVELFRGWREIFDRFPLHASPTYHALREYNHRPAVAIRRSLHPAHWQTLDRLEARDGRTGDRRIADRRQFIRRADDRAA